MPTERAPVFKGSTVRALRTALLESGFDADWLTKQPVAEAMAAYDRGWLEPVLAQVEAEASPRAVWARLFLLGQRLSAAVATAAGVPLQAAIDAGLLTSDSADEICHVQARWCIRPLPAADICVGQGSDPAEQHWWTVSGWPTAVLGAELPPDHVIGVGGASRSLGALTPRAPVGRALDLGTGCGVQVLGLAGHAEDVVATDLNSAALSAAALTCGLSGVARPTLLEGSLLEPVTGEFDLIVANPPFVLAPPGDVVSDFTYRDSPAVGDRLLADLLASASARLAPGATMVVMGNWLHLADEPWQRRLANWLPTGLAAWAGQRAVLSVPEYVELWLRDSGAATHLARRYRAWSEYLNAQGAVGVGFGFVALRRPPADTTPSTLIEDLTGARRLPNGEEVADLLAHLAGPPNAAHPLCAVVRAAPGSILAHRCAVGDDGTDYPVPATLSRPAGFRDDEILDSPLDWLLHRDRPRAPMRDLLRPCAEALGHDPDDILVSWLVGVRVLMERGFVTLDPPR